MYISLLRTRFICLFSYGKLFVFSLLGRTERDYFRRSVPGLVDMVFAVLKSTLNPPVTWKFREENPSITQNVLKRLSLVLDYFQSSN